MRGSFQLEDHLPLSEATLFILLSLAGAPRHGYAIMKETEALSKGRVLLSTGTLYGALKRLLGEGWIERVDDSQKENGRKRKAYRLTRTGQEILRAEVERLQNVVQAAELRTLEESA